MSGVLTGTPPRTDAQWARDVNQRLAQLEQSQVTRIGGWTLSDQNGSLVATQMGSDGISLNDLAAGGGTSVAKTVSTVVAGAAAPAAGTDATFLTNLESFFSDLNFMSPTFDPIAAAQLLVTDILSPTNLIATLSGGKLLSSVIPGLDASKIISGFFPFGQILGGTDLLGLLGNPTGLGSGTPALPGVGSIPLLSGLFSGGNILGSLIPGLDTSKIISGQFPTSMISGLDALLANVPGLSSIVSEITGLLDTGSLGLPTLGNWGSNLTNLFGVDLNQSSASFDPIASWRQAINTNGVPAGMLTSLTQIPGNLIGALGQGSGSVNQQVDPSFDDPNSLIGGGVWSYSTVGRTRAGSAVTTANGTTRRLVGTPVPTSEGKAHDLGGWFWWQNLVATGDAIYLKAQAYLPGPTPDTIGGPIPDGANQIIGTITNPTANPAGWTQLFAAYTAPAGAAWVRLVAEVTPNSASGNVYLDDMLHRRQQAIDATWLDNVGSLNGLLPANMFGVQGLPDMETLFGHFFDGLGSAFMDGGNVEGIQLPDLFDLAQEVTSLANGANNQALNNTNVLGVRNNKSLRLGMNPTSEGTVGLADVYDSTGAITTTTIPAGTALAQFIRPAETSVKGFMEFLATMTASTGVVANIYQDNPATGIKTLKWASADIAGLITASGVPQYARPLIPGGSQPIVNATELWMLEIANNSANPITIAVKKGGQPPHPTEYPPQWGATRTLASTGGVSPATIAGGAVAYSAVVPYISFGIQSVPTGYWPPVRSFQQSTHGDYTWSPPSQMKTGDIIDLIGVGSGGGGHGSSYGDPTGFAEGGHPGTWNAVKLVYGVDVKLGTTIAIHVATKGAAAGAWGVAGHNGSATTFTWTRPDNTTGTLTCAGGIGGQQGYVADNTGYGPGNETFDSQTYFGGATVGGQTNGNAPGGGGGGGTCCWTFGADGGDGGAFIYIYKASV